jgi:CheY-like chemotaxis protein
MTDNAPPVVLMAVSEDRPLKSVLEGIEHELYHVRSGALAVECANALRPDVIVIGLELSDMSGAEACRRLRAQPRVGHNVPILLLSTEAPTPEQRVAALEAGAWDFARYQGGMRELSLKVRTYVQAKRNIDAALAESAVQPEVEFHNRQSMARRARELGALLARVRGSLACVVFSLDHDPLPSDIGALVARASRVSDIVGSVRPNELAVIAPATDEAGAVVLARRVQLELGQGAFAGRAPAALNAGYDAVSNMGYRPMDPLALMARASAAVRVGKAVPGHPWLRRYEDSAAWRPQMADLDAVRDAASTERKAIV